MSWLAVSNRVAKIELVRSLRRLSSQEELLESKIAARDKRAAAVFWWILIAMRMVIPLYVLYAIYLYWTLPPSRYLLTGH
jgi:hypothetical protein